MSNVDLSKLHTNQRLFVQELIERGAEVSVIDYDLELLHVRYNGKSDYVIDRTTKQTAYLPSAFTADKHLTKYILQQNDITVPKGELFHIAQKSEAVTYAKELGFPVVIKPNMGSHGQHIWSGIENAEQLDSIIDTFLSEADGTEYFIIEQHIDGLEHRIFINTNGDYAVLQREPAYIIGDGESTIRQLAEADSLARKEIKEEEGSALCPIALDNTAQLHLARLGLDFDSVLQDNKKQYLRLSSNLAQGGISKDMTDEVHPSAINIAKRALAAFDGLPCLGVDFLTSDITIDQSNVKHAIIEANANPGISMHHMPIIGKSRNVASYVVDVMLPDLQSDK